MTYTSDAFSQNFFFDEVNRFSGSGGEILVKGHGNKGNKTLIEVGDQLIGIGITHTVESLSRNPGPHSFYLAKDSRGPAKVALRAFVVVGKSEEQDGYSFSFNPLSPNEYSNLLNTVSEGSIEIDPATISPGTVILSFLDRQPTYTLDRFPNSPATNWAEIVKSERHWNVGMGKSDDYWYAKFPGDDIGILTELPPWERVGQIRFGLSLLGGNDSAIEFESIESHNPFGELSSHQFSLRGAAVGTKGLETPFPIGLRTEIVFKPRRTDTFTL